MGRFPPFVVWNTILIIRRDDLGTAEQKSTQCWTFYFLSTAPTTCISYGQCQFQPLTNHTASPFQVSLEGDTKSLVSRSNKRKQWKPQKARDHFYSCNKTTIYSWQKYIFLDCQELFFLLCFEKLIKKALITWYQGEVTHYNLSLLCQNTFQLKFYICMYVHVHLYIVHVYITHMHMCTWAYMHIYVHSYKSWILDSSYTWWWNHS